MDNLPVNQKTGWMLSSEARADHREWIGGRAITLLNHYWRDDDPAEMTAAMGSDWADVLEGLPQDAIAKACIQYQRNEPRRKPTPGAIYQLARQFMPRPKVVSKPVGPQEPKEPRVTAEAAAKIMQDRGFKPRTFGGE